MPAVPTEVLSALTSAGVAPVHPTEKWASWGQQRAQGCSRQKLAGSVGGTENEVRGTEGDAPSFYCRGNYPYKGSERRGSGAELEKLGRSGPQPLPVPFNILCSDNG